MTDLILVFICEKLLYLDKNPDVLAQADISLNVFLIWLLERRESIAYILDNWDDFYGWRKYLYFIVV